MLRSDSSSEELSPLRSNGRDDVVKQKKREKKSKKKKRRKDKKSKCTEQQDDEEHQRGDYSIESVMQNSGLRSDQIAGAGYDRSFDGDTVATSSVVNDEVNLKIVKELIIKEVRCVMCVDILYKPVSLSCGHSLCRLCLLFAIKNMSSEYFGRFQCPTCRKTVCGKCSKRFQINTSLWNTIRILFPEEVAERDEASEKKSFHTAWKDHQGISLLEPGDISAGLMNYDLDDDFAFALVRVDECSLFKKCKVNRSVVRDPNDPVMHLALAVVREHDSIPLFVRKGMKSPGDTWQLTVALLELEVDEDKECGGFPTLLHDVSSESNRLLVKRAYSGPLSAEISVDEGSGEFSPIGSTESDFSDGWSRIKIDIGKLASSFSRIKLQLGSEQMPGLNLTCEVTADHSTNSERFSPAAFRPPASGVTQLGSDDEAIPGAINLAESEDESEPENYDEFEEDGFIVMEGDEGDEQSEAESDSESEALSSDSSSERSNANKRCRQRPKDRVIDISEEEDELESSGTDDSEVVVHRHRKGAKLPEGGKRKRLKKLKHLSKK